MNVGRVLPAAGSEARGCRYMKNPKMLPWTESCPSKTLYMAVSAPGGVHAAVSSSIQFMVFTRNIFSNSVNRKKNPLMVPGWQKAQILHFSAGVTLRLYSGNRVWNEVYSPKRWVFWNQIMRRYYRAFLILFSEPSSRLSKKQPTNEEARAPARTVNRDGENLILPPTSYLPFGD